MIKTFHQLIAISVCASDPGSRHTQLTGYLINSVRQSAVILVGSMISPFAIEQSLIRTADNTWGALSAACDSLVSESVISVR